MQRSLPISAILLSATLLLQPRHSLATHIIGGEIAYECLGTDTYKITLKLYRDCYLGLAAFDDPTYVHVFDSTGVWMTYFPIAFPGSDTLDPSLSDPCLILPPNICVEEAVFDTIVYLPPVSGGYHFVFQRCCRNNSIVNIVDPGNTGATWDIYMPDTSLAVCNSSPAYKTFPPIVICVNKPINFDHSATDKEGDSLAYSLCTPYNGASAFNPYPFPPSPPPYIFITWQPPYSAVDPLGGVPLTIDPVTGWLTGVPGTVGQFVVGVCVSEYRNGQLLSVNKRDFQFNVAVCGEVAFSPSPDTAFCSGDTVVIGPPVTDPTYQYAWSPSAGLSNDSVPNPQLCLVNPSDTPVTVIYILAVEDTTGCIGYDTVSITVYPLPPAQAGPDVTIIKGQSAGLSASGGVSYSWSPATGLSCTDCPDPAAGPEDTTTYTVTVTSAEGCRQSDDVTVYVIIIPFVDIPNAFTPNEDGANDVFSMESLGLREARLRIFNRWGELVFETTNPKEGWDGNYRYAPQPSGTYVYDLEAVSIYDEHFHKFGSVALIR